MEKQLKLFFNFLENEKQASNNTLQSYRRDIKQYENYLEQKQKTYSQVTSKEMKEYIDHLSEIGKKPSTISRNIASIRSFYQYEVKNKSLSEDPTEGIQSPKVEKRVPSILTSNEVSLLLEQPKANDLKGIRDKAMLEFAYATGMRVTEIISLNVKDVNLDEGYVVCQTGSKKRTIPLGNISLQALKDYMNSARNVLIKKDDTEALFVNINGTRLTRQGFWKIIKYYKEQAQYTKLYLK